MKKLPIYEDKKELTKEDLNSEEMGYYNEIMKGVDGATDEEKEEVAELIETIIEAEEEGKVKCLRCGKPFENEGEEGYCQECLSKMFNPNGIED